jgi:hypothetical protein
MNENELSEQKISDIVSCVASGRQARLPDSEIANQLLSMGVKQSEVAQLLLFVTNALQQGVLAGVTDGASTQNIIRGESELFDAAFDKGLQSYKNGLRSELLPCRIVIVCIFIVVAFVIYFIVR